MKIVLTIALALTMWLGSGGPAQAADLAAAHAARKAGDQALAMELYRAIGAVPEAQFWLGTLQRWAGELDAAAGTFADLLTAHPDYGDGLIGDAYVALRQGDLERAEQRLYRRLLKRPNDQEARSLLLSTHRRGHGVRSTLKLVDRLYEGDERVRVQAEQRFSAHWYRSAARRYEQLRELQPDDVALVLALGHTYERMGYTLRAEQLYRDGLRSHPGDRALLLRTARVELMLEADGPAREAVSRLTHLLKPTEEEQVIGARHAMHRYRLVATTEDRWSQRWRLAGSEPAPLSLTSKVFAALDDGAVGHDADRGRVLDESVTLAEDPQTPYPSPEVWLAPLLTEYPASYRGRRQLAQVEYRRGAFTAAERLLTRLHRERPELCAVCAEWQQARGQRMPVLESGFRLANSHSLDGRSDRVLVPTTPVTPVRYHTVSLWARASHRLTHGLSLGASYRTDDRLLEVRNGGSVYDFRSHTGWLTATRHLAHDHTVSGGIGGTVYRSGDSNSIADRNDLRLRLSWDRKWWHRQAHVSIHQGPYLGRGLAAQNVFRIFREQRVNSRGEIRLSQVAGLFGSASFAHYSDGNNRWSGEAGARFYVGAHRVRMSLFQSYQQGRFLDEKPGGFQLALIPTRGARLSDRWQGWFPWQLSAYATVRYYEPYTINVRDTSGGLPGVLVPRRSSSNQEVAYGAEAAYAHPALKPFSTGVAVSHVRFDHDVFAYNTIDATDVTGFVQVADRDVVCWSYLARYEVGVVWDEDPTNNRFYRHRFRGQVGYAVGQHLSAELRGEYGFASQFGEQGIEGSGHLVWRF